MQPYNIFIAEDDEDDQYLLQSAFSIAGDDCALRFFSSGDALLHHLRTSDDVPAFLLLDLNMPGLNGFQTLAHLRADTRLRPLPVVILTTSSDQRDVMQAYDMGANTFITKPHSYDDLCRMVRHLNRFWLGTAAIPAQVNARWS